MGICGVEVLLIFLCAHDQTVGCAVFLIYTCPVTCGPALQCCGLFIDRS